MLRDTLDQMIGNKTTCKFSNASLWVVFVYFLFAAGAAAQDPALVYFRLHPRDVVEKHLKSFSDRNGEREVLIRKWLAEAGCADSNLSEQSIERKLPPNVICVLPGELPDAIVVGAHTDHVDDFGDGVVDNWTGAVLLPSLLYSLNGKTRRHTFIFVGFSAEEKGLVGSSYYADHMSKTERANVKGMVNFDSLGLGPTKVWISHADKALMDPLKTAAAASHLPLGAVNVESVGASTDSESFARYHVPRITLHSITTQTYSILHSSSDKFAAIKMNDYYDSYKLMAEYLAYLDLMLRTEIPAVKPQSTQ
jgi:Peptidase family M28